MNSGHAKGKRSEVINLGDGEMCQFGEEFQNP